jgi:hypothetical protein
MYPLYNNYNRFKSRITNIVNWSPQVFEKIKLMFISMIKDINLICTTKIISEQKGPDFFGKTDVTPEVWQGKMRRVIQILDQINMPSPFDKDVAINSFEPLKRELDAIFFSLLKTDTDEKILSPSISDFLKRATKKYVVIDQYSPFKVNGVQQYDAQGNAKYLEKYLGDSIYEDIGVDWQAGLFEIRQNKEFLYEYTQTDDILSYLLTLRLNKKSIIKTEGDSDSGLPVVSTLGAELKFFDSTQNKEVKVNPRAIGTKFAFETYDKLLKYSYTDGSEISLGVLLLFVFTLVENIMNKTKFSFFLDSTEYVKINFESKQYWNVRLFQVINQVFQQVTNTLEDGKPIVNLLKIATQGGGFDKEKTRKVKRHTSKNKTLKH